MGSLTGMIRDDIREYERNCDLVGVEPRRGSDGFANPYTDHAKEVNEVARRLRLWMDSVRERLAKKDD